MGLHTDAHTSASPQAVDICVCTSLRYTVSSKLTLYLWKCMRFSVVIEKQIQVSIS